MLKRADVKRQVQTRTQETAASYAKRVQSLRQAAERDHGSGLSLCQVAEWLSMRDYQYADATARQYRAAILAAASEAVACGQMSEEEHAETRWLLHQRPVPKSSGARRTSARKRKSMPEPEFWHLVEELKASRTSGDHFLAKYVVMGVMFFVRPCEWERARLEGTQLVIVSAKTTNGRSHGPTRSFDLSAHSQAEIRAVRVFLTQIRERSARAGSFPSAMRRIARSLTRACKRLGIKPIAPYSLRHIGVASAKCRIGLRAVAYLAGHASERTAGTHYARASSGLRGFSVVFPLTEEQTKKVRPNNRRWSLDHIRHARIKRIEQPARMPLRLAIREAVSARLPQHQGDPALTCGFAQPRM